MQTKTLLFMIIIAAAVSAEETISDMPSNLKTSIEWVWKNRISPKSASAPLGEGSTVRKNLIFDQIYFEKGTLLYCGRWQSMQKLTLENRKKLAQVVSTKINNWTRLLSGYDGWPYDEIPVKIVGWAVLDASVVEDKQPDEIVYTTTEHDAVHDDDARVPANVPVAPNACSRFEHFTDSRYTYASCPAGAENRFDMYLWATTSWMGAVGGDWGQRMSESAWLSGSMMIDHEMGHGFGITDFYEVNQRPEAMNNGSVKSIMWAGNSTTITEWDKWMLRYMWTQLKTDTGRFPPQTVVSAVTNGMPPRGIGNYSVRPVGNTIIVKRLVPRTTNQPVMVKVLDIAGRIVVSHNISSLYCSSIIMPAESFRSGFHIVTIIDNDGSSESHGIILTGSGNRR